MSLQHVNVGVVWTSTLVNTLIDAINAAAPASPATTVAGLGTPSDGKPGVLICGASPYDILNVTYSATYGHWVSAPFIPSGVTTGTGLSANNTANTWQSATATGAFPYGTFLNAGLTLQYRLTMTLGPGGSTTDAGLVMASAAAGAAFSANTADAVAITSTGAFVAADTGWLTAPVPTAAAYAVATIRGRNTANNTGQWGNMMLAFRWIA